MRKSRPHHAENLVIALAVLLALVLAYFGAQKAMHGGGAAAGAKPPYGDPGGLKPSSGGLVGSGTQAGVTGLAPLKMTRVRSGHASKSAAPPAPKTR